MSKRAAHFYLASPNAWLWGLLGVCLAASLWLVVRSERKWAAAQNARQAHQPSPGNATVASRSHDEAIASKALRGGAATGAASSTGQSPAGRPVREERTTIEAARVRHRLGPEAAAVQMVLFFDYECARCQRVEGDARALMKRFPDDVSLSLVHCPQSTDCDHSLKVNTHPNACRAAQAAETAAIIKGEPGFWEMHAWLFQRLGRFSLDELRDVLPTLGYDDVDHFFEIMNGEEPGQRILRDLLDSAALPNVGPATVVMNGIQLEGGEIEDAMAQAVRFLQREPPAGPSLASPGDASPQGAFSAEMLTSAVAATVQVLNLSNGDLGSGVMIGRERSTVYLLTADHLLVSQHRPADERQSALNGDRFEIRAFSDGGKLPATHRSVRVVARSPDDDLAVLSFSTRQDVPALLAICPPRQIPDDEPFPALSLGWTRGGVLTSAAGQVSARKRVRKRSQGPAALVWELNRPSKPGQSGGPLVDRRGSVVGIASGNSGGHGYFCHTAAIHRLLDNSGLERLYTARGQK